MVGLREGDIIRKGVDDGKGILSEKGRSGWWGYGNMTSEKE